MTGQLVAQSRAELCRQLAKRGTGKPNSLDGRGGELGLACRKEKFYRSEDSVKIDFRVSVRSRVQSTRSWFIPWRSRGVAVKTGP